MRLAAHVVGRDWAVYDPSGAPPLRVMGEGSDVEKAKTEADLTLGAFVERA